MCCLLSYLLQFLLFNFIFSFFQFICFLFFFILSKVFCFFFFSIIFILLSILIYSYCIFFLFYILYTFSLLFLIHYLKSDLNYPQYMYFETVRVTISTPLGAYYTIHDSSDRLPQQIHQSMQIVSQIIPLKPINQHRTK